MLRYSPTFFGPQNSFVGPCVAGHAEHAYVRR